MAQRVSEVTNLNEKIVLAARVIGKSKARRKVFESIYFGKTKWRSVADIQAATDLDNKQVLNAAVKLAHHEVVEQSKVNGKNLYSKDKQLAHHKNKILKAAGSKAQQEKIPTAQNPRGSAASIRIAVPRSAPPPKEITVDDILSFKAVRDVKSADPAIKLNRTREEVMKTALKRIIGESHDFKDWGGEKNDLFTNKLRVTSKRQSAAFALKGKATPGPLTPKKMGKNGDQIERLVGSSATVFMVVYHGKVADSIHGQLQAFALGKSMSGQRISYGVIDGDDLNRLMQAYPAAFKSKGK